MGIAEIASDGTFIITKQPNSNGFNGMVTDVTVRSQILYEIQGNVSCSLERGADARSTSTPTCRAFWTTSR